MTFERAVELLKIEKMCVESANTCDRNCAECPLVQDDKELIEMYEMAISAMTAISVRTDKVHDDSIMAVVYKIARDSIINRQRRTKNAQTN